MGHWRRCLVCSLNAFGTCSNFFTKEACTFANALRCFGSSQLCSRRSLHNTCSSDTANRTKRTLSPHIGIKCLRVVCEKPLAQVLAKLASYPLREFFNRLTYHIASYSTKRRGGKWRCFKFGNKPACCHGKRRHNSGRCGTRLKCDFPLSLQRVHTTFHQLYKCRADFGQLCGLHSHDIFCSLLECSARFSCSNDSRYTKSFTNLGQTLCSFRSGSHQTCACCRIQRSSACPCYATGNSANGNQGSNSRSSKAFQQHGVCQHSRACIDALTAHAAKCCADGAVCLNVPLFLSSVVTLVQLSEHSIVFTTCCQCPALVIDNHLVHVAYCTRHVQRCIAADRSKP